MSREPRGVQSIEVGARLLMALAEQAEPMMLRDIANAAEIAPAQAHAYMVSYRKSGLVEQEEATGRYRLGPFALMMALAKLRGFDPIGVADRRGRMLCDETGLSVAISVWGAYGPTVVRVLEVLGEIHMNTRPGTVYSLTGTATGKLFAHYLPEALVSATLRQQRSEAARSRIVGSAVDLRQVQAEVDFVGDHGYAVTDSTPVPGISAISAPVFEVGGQLSLALTIIGRDDVIDRRPESTHLKALLAAANDISAQLGHFEKPEGRMAAPANASAGRRPRRNEDDKGLT
ncbi:IclR family transcriptional regulator [Pseudaminobacter salicylatoxidans]|uniref:IclR family transcriptional regulator n=1 Tax=Pseudaminobacter salicylatoxidans TaxID=93369 RepID=UPI0003775893|nr:IclR family transcriptional regulator [Pseudaminobacter salicylatoxidans]